MCVVDCTSAKYKFNDFGPKKIVEPLDLTDLAQSLADLATGSVY